MQDHRALAEWSRAGSARRSAPTQSSRSTPPVGATALSELEAAADREIGDYATFVTALAERRAAFKALGGTATDHAATSADTSRLADREASALFANALAGECSPADARRFEAHMLNEFARMSSDDGLVMQLHVGSLRDHNGPLAERFGRDIGADIPVATDWTRGLRPLLEACGNDPGFAVILFTLDESTYSRELAPLAGHYPAVLLGCPWWFHDSPAGIDRFLDRVTETAGLVQPRRVRRRRARADGSPGAARPLAPPHVRLARAEGRGGLPRRGGGAPARVGARLRTGPPRLSA